MINPATHPRRHAAHIERQLAYRARALAIALTSDQVARRMGISTLRAEQLGAKYGFAYTPLRKK